MGICIISVDSYAQEGDEHTPSHDPLREGYIDCGNPLDPTGEARWFDSSFGPSYGDGRRYETEETYGMTKVASRHKRHS